MDSQKPILIYLMLLILLNAQFSCNSEDPGETTNKEVKVTKATNSDDDSGTQCEENAEDCDIASEVPENFESKSFFSSYLRPKLDSNCSSCHNIEPRTPIDMRGTMTIWEHDTLVEIITASSKITPESNDVIDRLTGKRFHTGGVICETLEASPCKELQIFVAGNDFKATAGGAGANEFGNIDNISPFGLINGEITSDYAANPIDFYDMDKTESSATKLGSVQAEESAAGGKFYFEFQLPSDLRDGTERKLYAYTGDNALGSSGENYAAYTPKAEAFFNNTVKPQMDASCGGNNCHGVQGSDRRTYEGMYDYLISPPPFKGGSDTNNFLHNYASGEDNNGHRRCTTGNGACAAFEQWWQEEFQ